MWCSAVQCVAWPAGTVVDWLTRAPAAAAAAAVSPLHSRLASLTVAGRGVCVCVCVCIDHNTVAAVRRGANSIVARYSGHRTVKPWFDEQQAQRLQTDHATRCVSSDLVKCFTAVQKIAFERLAVRSDPEGDSRSSELPLFDRPYITSCYRSVVTVTLTGTVSEILPHLQCTWLPMTLRSPFSKRYLKLQTTCAFWFICEHIVDNTSHISGGLWDRKVSNSKSDLNGH